MEYIKLSNVDRILFNDDAELIRVNNLMVEASKIHLSTDAVVDNSTLLNINDSSITFGPDANQEFVFMGNRELNKLLSDDEAKADADFLKKESLINEYNKAYKRIKDIIKERKKAFLLLSQAEQQKTLEELSKNLGNDKKRNLISFIEFALVFIIIIILVIINRR